MDTADDTNKLEMAAISYNDLRLKQSVRTTFKLPKGSINLLTLVASHLGIKQKSLLDQLTEDKNLLDKLAEEVEPGSEEERRLAKTFVISRNSLQSINEVAKKQNVPRDLLMEVSINRLLPVMESELERHIRRKNIFRKMKQLLSHCQALHQEAKDELGEDDQLFGLIDKQLLLSKKNMDQANVIIKKGLPMEDW